jgi:hypothetical protein
MYLDYYIDDFLLIGAEFITRVLHEQVIIYKGSEIVGVRWQIVLIDLLKGRPH